MTVVDRPPYVSDEALAALISAGLREDVGPGDVTSTATVPEGTSAHGTFVCKQNGVLGGLGVASEVFRTVDPGITTRWSSGDGTQVSAGDVFGEVYGPARGILAAERLALNILQRMGGIATMTREMVNLATPYGAQILDTRKTAPGLRILDKWAVLLGGGRNHRLGLHDMILVKENHIACAGGLEQAVRAANLFAAGHRPRLQIEVEVTSLDEVRRAVDLEGIDFLLLDNMTSVDAEGRLDTTMLVEAVRLVDGSVKTEASGNVTLETVEQIARTGVNNISCGALTHSVQALDVSLLLNFRA